MKAPEFALPDQNGEVHKLIYYHGKWVVLYFYPKDDTPGCTKEACSFRDNFHDLQARGVEILGVSKDSVASHKKFAEKYNLNFPILSDESAETSKAYGSWSAHQMLGLPGIKRMTFLINPAGEIVKTYDKVDPLTHSGEILKDLEALLGDRN